MNIVEKRREAGLSIHARKVEKPPSKWIAIWI
jgi:hypothetical protein